MPFVVVGARYASWTLWLATLGLVVVWSTGCAAPTTMSDGIGETEQSSTRQAAAAATDTGSNAVAGSTGAAAPGAACSTPAEGCPCATEGAEVECPGPKIHTANYTSCLPGKRTCSDGTWGACLAPGAVQNANQVTQDDTSPCPSGTAVRWGALTVDGLTPGDSRIRVSVQTASTQAALDSATPVALGTFSGSTETSWTSTDADAALTSAGLSSMAWLRVTLTLSPETAGGGAPTVADWRQASACVPAPAG